MPPTDTPPGMSPGTSPGFATEPASLIERLGLRPGHATIVGLQWGDEGKGKVVDMLAAEFDAVARYNGGANAGHTVVVGDQQYKLHLMPSGILYPGKINVLGNGVVIDPEQLVSEIVGNRERGLTIDTDTLFISNRAHLVMPYHKTQDKLQEAAYTMPNALDQVVEGIGTTGRGIGPCYADKALRSTAIRVNDLLDLDELRHQLHRIVPIKNATLKALCDYTGQTHEPIDADALLDWLKPLAEVLVPHVADTAGLLGRITTDERRILFEGANATLLDIDHGTYPYVTSSNCSSLGAHTGTGVPGHRVGNVIGIVKAYQTRVGGGPMPTELDDATGERIREVGREYGTTTGRPRRCGWIDLVALKYTASVSGATCLCVMLLDVLADLPELKLCTGYQIDGQTIERFPACSDDLAKIEPIYQTLPGFEGPVDHCRSIDELPDNAKAYLDFIADFLGVPVVLASVGPKRDQTAVR
ncbi:MAG: adenylosuccinate synthase [Phycisphaeraceae bacterium]